MDDEVISKHCSRCGGILEVGYIASPGGIGVVWIGPKTGILSHKSANIVALRCPKCGQIQLESKPDLE